MAWAEQLGVTHRRESVCLAEWFHSIGVRHVKYSEYRPTTCDQAGLGCDDRQDWEVAPCGQNRDSDCLEESNFAAQLAMLGGESDTVEVHRFGHWACGWFEICLVAPSRASEVENIECALANYPVLNESDFSEREQEAADEMWRGCFSPAERITYIRRFRNQFEFRDLVDMVACVRGRYFAGCASELLP